MYFSQKDPRWTTKKLGYGKLTLAQAGCFITSISNLHKYFTDEKIDPSKMNDKAKKCGAFNVDMLNAGVLAKELGYNYSKQTKTPKDRCIIETNHYAKVGVPQHFVFYNPATKLRIDPLDLNPSWETNNYPIVSYRIFTKIPAPKPVKVESKVVTPPTPITPTVTTPDAPQEIPVQIKLSELPPIKKTLWQIILDIIFNNK